MEAGIILELSSSSFRSKCLLRVSIPPVVRPSVMKRSTWDANMGNDLSARCAHECEAGTDDSAEA